MIPRYTLKPFDKLWSDESKFRHWLKVELAVLYARMQLGEITGDAYEAISECANFDVERIDELEAEFDHDLIAFVVCVQEYIEKAGYKEYASEFHKKLTSFDTEDPALVLMLRSALNEILNQLNSLIDTFKAKSIEHKWSLMMAITHGQNAEPGSFGALLLVYYNELLRCRERFFVILDDDLSEAKISGSVGIYGELNPEIEKIALDRLGLEPAKAETQIMQRDRIANLLSAITITGSVIEQISRTLWEMMRSSNKLLEEPRRTKQRGSSAMVHKKNPILTERMMGMPRVLRGYILAAMEGIATPECRDISQSCVERIIIPDSTTLIHYMLSKMTNLIGKMTVFKEAMADDVNVKSYGVWASQIIRNNLMSNGLDYNTAYDFLQNLCFCAVNENVHLKTLLSQSTFDIKGNKTVHDFLSVNLDELFNATNYIRNGINHIYEQNGLTE